MWSKGLQWCHSFEYVKKIKALFWKGGNITLQQGGTESEEHRQIVDKKINA